MSIKFSILICSLESRKKMLNELLHRLEIQMTPEVEIVQFIDNGELTIGAKRNQLVKRSKGEYIAFIDDDDLVSFDYISKILKAIEKKPDCCGIEGIITFSGETPAPFSHSVKHKHWINRNGVYYRFPNHLNPVKRDIARKAKFPSSNQREDRAYADQIFPKLKKEVYLNGPIYYYLFKKVKRDQLSGPYEIKKIKLEGDFSLTAKLQIMNLKGSASGITINDSVFGFEGRGARTMFVEGDLFKGLHFKESTIKYIREAKPFSIKIINKKKNLNIYINGKLLIGIPYSKKKTKIGFRPMRSTMNILDVEVK